MFYVMDVVQILMNNLQAINLYFIKLVGVGGGQSRCGVDTGCRILSNENHGIVISWSYIFDEY